MRKFLSVLSSTLFALNSQPNWFSCAGWIGLNWQMAFSRAQLSWQSSAQSQAPSLLERNSPDSECKTPSSWFCLKIHVELLVVVFPIHVEHPLHTSHLLTTYHVTENVLRILQYYPLFSQWPYDVVIIISMLQVGKLRPKGSKQFNQIQGLPLWLSW